MTKGNQRTTTQKNKRLSRRNFRMEPLESRLMLSAVPLQPDTTSVYDNDYPYVESRVPTQAELNSEALLDAFNALSDDTGDKQNLRSIPRLSSHPGAEYTIYLSFDGRDEANWGGFMNVHTPVFDLDRDPTTFNAQERDAMRAIWQYVAEDYAPFNVNVTTIAPKSLADGNTILVSIGGNGAWYGAAGGVALLDSFTSGITSTVYVFPEMLGNNTKAIADASSHEVGHALGLDHQSLWVDGDLVAEYNPGSAALAPIMGNSYASTRSVWWEGPTPAGEDVIQNDIAIITDRLGLRPDDHGKKFNLGTDLTINADGTTTATGQIHAFNESDYFRFTTGAGEVTFTVTVPERYNNLDAYIEIRDSANRVLAPGESVRGSAFNSTVTVTLPEGTYAVVVLSKSNRSGGSMSTRIGDIGTYTLTGTVADFSIAAPIKLVARSGDQGNVSLTWKDIAKNEQGYEIFRSTDGNNWQRIHTTVANVSAFTDTTASASVSYSYKVRAFGPTGASQFSNIAESKAIGSAPTAPKNLRLTPAIGQVALNWKDNSNNETGFLVQRSADNGRTWEDLGRVDANNSNIVDRKVDARRTYQYRVAAFNAVGQSGWSNEASATVPGIVLVDQGNPNSGVGSNTQLPIAFRSLTLGGATSEAPASSSAASAVDDALLALTDPVPTTTQSTTSGVDKVLEEWESVIFGRFGNLLS